MKPGLWVLHLDVDREYAVGRGYSPPRGSWSDPTSWLESPELGSYFREGDWVVFPRPDDGGPLGRVFQRLETTWTEWPFEPFSSRSLGESFPTFFWSPTPRSIRLAQALGARIPKVPAFEVLRQVNRRSLLRSLGQGIAIGVWIQNFQDFEVWRASRPDPGPWRLKPEYGASGRGQVRFRVPEFEGSLEERVRSAEKRGHCLRIEPDWTILREASLGAWLGPEGRLVSGEVLGQSVDTKGQWQGSYRFGAGEAENLKAFLRARVEAVARELRVLGYFGPFGLDALEGAWAQEEAKLALLEVNARATMAWAKSLRSRGLDPAEIMLAGSS